MCRQEERAVVAFVSRPFSDRPRASAVRAQGDERGSTRSAEAAAGGERHGGVGGAGMAGASHDGRRQHQRCRQEHQRHEQRLGAGAHARRRFSRS